MCIVSNMCAKVVIYIFAYMFLYVSQICIINYGIKYLQTLSVLAAMIGFWWQITALYYVDWTCCCMCVIYCIYSINLYLPNPRKNTGRGSSGTYAFTQSASKKLCIGTCKARLAKNVSFSQVSHTDSNGKNRFWMVFSVLCPSAPSSHIYLSLLEAWSVLKAPTITVSSVSP